MIGLLTWIGWTDWHQQLIYHRATIPGIVVAMFVSSQLPSGSPMLALIGALSGMALFASFRLLAKRYYGEHALGFGDVMLAGVIGAIGGIVAGLLMLAVGMLAAGVFSAIQLQWQTVSRLDAIPYGTFLCGGAIAVLLWGQLQ